MAGCLLVTDWSITVCILDEASMKHEPDDCLV